MADAKMFAAPEGAVDTLDPMSVALTLANWPGNGRLDCTVRIGQQTIRCEGKKVVLGRTTCSP